MTMNLVKPPIWIIVMIHIFLFGAGISEGDKSCSCYTFEIYEKDSPMNWVQAKDACKLKNKHLVVMETEQEWEFITKEIQTRQSGRHDEWFIGLYKNLSTGKWTWVNGKALTISKWLKDRPRIVHFYTIMAKEFPLGIKGSFNSIHGNVYRAWICEEETDNCGGVCFSHIPVTTNSTPPVTPTPTTQEQRTTSTAYNSTTAPDPTREELTTRHPGKGNQAYEKDNCSLSVIILASLVAVLSVALLIFGVCFLSWRKKQGKDTRRATDTGNQLDNQDGSLLSPETAARQLAFSDKAEPHGIELEYQRRGTVQGSRQECEYAMLTPQTMMVPGESSYASLVKSKQEDCTSGPSVAASPLLQQDSEPHDELPTYINVNSAKKYLNISA